METSGEINDVSPLGKGSDRSLEHINVAASSSNDFSIPTSTEDPEFCWICLDGATPTQPLVYPCKCPRVAHPTCVARWQLQSAGTRRETHCQFCEQDLPDWKRTLTPQCGANAPAIMNVNFNDRTFSFEVKPGPDGYRKFTDAIRKAFGLPEDSELNITFTCDEPVNQIESEAALASQITQMSEPVAPATPPPSIMQPMDTTPSSPATPTSNASLLTLQGAGAYDAAVHCASVSAAKRRSQSSPLSSPGLPLLQGPSTLQAQRGLTGSPNPSNLSRTLPFSNIPGYGAYPQQVISPTGQAYRERQQMGLGTARRPYNFPEAFNGLATQIPSIEEPRLSSIPRRNNASSFIQRAQRAVKQSFRGGRKDRDDRGDRN